MCIDTRWVTTPRDDAKDIGAEDVPVARAVTRPRVSIVMPVHNEERYIRGAVESILHQSFSDWELIIVDDASTDTTPTILWDYSDNRIRVLCSGERGGDLGSVLNKGIEACRADLIARMDADDISYPRRLSEQLSFLDSHAAVGLVGCWAHEIDHEGRVVGMLSTPVSDPAIKWQLNYRNPLHHPSVLMRRSLLESVGGYDSSMRHAEDYDLFCRMGRVARIYSLDQILIAKRSHGVSASVAHGDEQTAIAVQIAGREMGPRLPFVPSALLLAAILKRRFSDRASVGQAADLMVSLHRSMAREFRLTSRADRAELDAAACEAILALGRISTAEGRCRSAQFRAFAVAPRTALGAALRVPFKGNDAR